MKNLITSHSSRRDRVHNMQATDSMSHDSGQIVFEKMKLDEKLFEK